MLLRHIITALSPTLIQGSLNLTIAALATDTRRVVPGSLFIATNLDTEAGFERANEAVNRGASAVVCRDGDFVTARVTRIRVTDPCEAVARAAAAFYSHPAAKLEIVRLKSGSDTAVSAFQARQLLEREGQKVGLISSLGCWVGDRFVPPPPSGFDGIEVQRLLGDMVKAGCRVCVVEGRIASPVMIFGSGAARWREVESLAEAAGESTRAIPVPEGLSTSSRRVAVPMATPGCAERIQLGQDFSLVVDRSATSARLAAVLNIMRQQTEGRLFLVFGAKGCHAPEMRHAFGLVAAKLADAAWITTDDPEKVRPEFLAADVGSAWKAVREDGLTFISDRAAAIHAALGEARAGDAVLIAGKGADTVQRHGDTIVPFDDRGCARLFLEREHDRNNWMLDRLLPTGDVLAGRGG
jgi:UDP-N-acetylmuramyl tripeptide synthase